MSFQSSPPINPAEAFASATLEIIEPKSLTKKEKAVGRRAALNQKSSSSLLHTTRAYYRDSSGRARVRLRVRLAVPTTTTDAGSEDDDKDEDSVGLEALIECGCIVPPPVESDGSTHTSSSNAIKEDELNDAKEENDDEDEEFMQNELSNIGKDMEESKKWYTDTTFAFECTCPSSSSTSKSDVAWALEGVTILHSEIERSDQKWKKKITALLFDVEVAVRGNGIVRINDTMEKLEDGTLELCAVLRQRRKYRGNNDTDDTNMGSNNNNGSNHDNLTSKKSSLLVGGSGGISAGLLGLEYGGGALSPSLISRGLGSSERRIVNAKRIEIEDHYGVQILRTKSLQLHTTLIPPIQLTVREVCGARAASGSTLVEITVEHSSKWHKEDVIVTGIAFHPGQSRLWGENSSIDAMIGNGDNQHGENESRTTAITTSSSSNNVNVISEGKSMQGGELSVIDMSRRVRWGFAAGSAPELPLILGQYEAFATVIQIDAGEDVRSRAFLSPISVNAMIGESEHNIVSSTDMSNKENQEKSAAERIMITADARWTSSRVGVENSDAFRVDMSLRGGLETACRVGAPIVVSLRVLNLSMEPRDLMLLMAKDGEGRNSGLQWERPAERRRRITGRERDSDSHGPQLLHQNTHVQHTKENQSFNTAVVSEVNGYTFGVWGLSGDDDGATRHHRDHELLAVDAALLLGEVKGQHSIEAELRFVPLREGTLDVPNLKLYDKRGCKWYNCVHTLKIVARQSESPLINK